MIYFLFMIFIMFILPCLIISFACFVSDDTDNPNCFCPKCKKNNWASWYQEYPKTDRFKHSMCLNCGFIFDKKLHYKSAKENWMSEKTPCGSDYID